MKARTLGFIILAVSMGLWFSKKNEDHHTDKPKHLFSKKGHSVSNVVPAESKVVDEFQRLTDMLRQNMPTTESVRRLPPTLLHQPHSMLAPILGPIGELRELWERSPLQRPKALAWYKECAQNHQALPSLRILCLANVLELSEILGQNLDDLEFDRELLARAENMRLADR